MVPVDVRCGRPRITGLNFGVSVMRTGGVQMRHLRFPVGPGVIACCQWKLFENALPRLTRRETCH